jgi:hypothetical protein
MTANRRTSKKQRKTNGSVATTADPEINGSAEHPPAPEPSASPVTVEPSLMTEVESFLGRRDELAKKLADEIVATEKKLAELKKTAASLFPEMFHQERSARKAKKHKAKSSNREEKNAVTSAPENVPPAAVTS